MAVPSGYRFPVTMADLFPAGFYALGVEQAEDYDVKTGRRTPTRDKQRGEQFVWTVTGIDRDPLARKKEVKVKVTAPYMPDLPPEILPGSGLRLVEFTGLTVTPYVEEPKGSGRARLALSFRATGVQEQGKAPAGPATVTGRSDRLAAHSGNPPGDGKAA
jgi:hypothetical protein